MRYKYYKGLGKDIVPDSRRLNLVNIRYTVDNLRFDAAVDINWELHAYADSNYEEENWKTTTAIEIYCLDNRNWDIKMIYQKSYNSESHTVVDFENLVEETKKWIKEMSK